MPDSDGVGEGPARSSDVTPARPPCPACGSAHTQPFTHAGPVARVNMKCIDCGTLFKAPRARD